MSKKFLFLVAILSFLLLIKPNLVNAEENDSSDDSELVTGFKYHDNAITFQFVNDSNFRSASFTPTDGCVTSGQDKKGYFEDSIGKAQTIISGGKFHFTCGRKGSKQVANWFNARTNNGKYTTFDHSAGKLNFAVEGTLKIDLGCEIVVIDDLMLAQGHTGTSNNWWCGTRRYCQQWKNGVSGADFIRANAKVYDDNFKYLGLRTVDLYRTSPHIIDSSTVRIEL